MELNWTTIIVAVIGSIPAGIIAWHTKQAVNGAMHAMLKIGAEKATAEATVAARTAEDGRNRKAKRRPR